MSESKQRNGLVMMMTGGVKVVDLPPKRTLGDMKNEELLALV